MEPQTGHIKKQVLIFVGIAFALPFALGILMGIGYSRGVDLSVFPTAQMMYPAAGVMLAALVTRRGDPLLPRRFFACFLVLTALVLLCSVASFFVPGPPWNAISQCVLIGGSVIAWVFLLTEKREKRMAYGLRGRQWNAAGLIVLLFVALYFLRTALSYLVGGQAQMMVAILRDPNTWLMLGALVLNYFLVFVAFLGEEYGWRYYLQPLLQKRLGMLPGILVLGVVWGLWHLPINFFYYTSPAVGFISVAGQLVTCITLGAFFGWAYLKTDNIWTVVVLHFVNNNLVPIVTGTYTADVLQGQTIAWPDVLFSLLVNGVLFLWVLFTGCCRDYNRRLPTMDERADWVGEGTLAGAAALDSARKR